MNIQQIADIIDKNNWLFTVVQFKPKHKHLVKSRKPHLGTAEYIEKLIKENKSEEIQIMPVSSNGTSKTYGAAKTITINFKKEEMNIDNTQFTALAGLSGLGLNMAEIFTAKEKAEEVIELKQKINLLESENKTLEKENTKLENKIEINEMKKAQKNELLEVIKSPQVMTLATALLSRSTVPALGAPGQQANKDLDEKIQWLINFLELEGTPDMTKDFMIYIAKAHQNENAATIIKELANILMKHNIIQSKKSV